MGRRGLILVISSLTSGGAERVMSEIANHSIDRADVSLIVLSKREKFYHVNDKINFIEPHFTIDEMSRMVFMWKNFFWLRRTLKSLKAKSVLSFGGKYNSYVLLANMGLGKRVFVSDRSRPGISYGKFLDILNPLVYKVSAGIIAQTTKAKEYAKKQTGHKNIKVIPNPVPIISHDNRLKAKENIILSVGRFIPSKHQGWLVSYFSEIDNSNWKCVFLGDGVTYNEVRQQVEKSAKSNKIELKGNVSNVTDWYMRSAIFAFTSTSEGFPNALAEAMAAGCACIAYDCIAGPSDIIDNEVNGFLIPEGDHETYKKKLSELMGDAELRKRFGKAAREKMKQFEASKITKQFLDFILE
ncbi:glycosyltransferase [Salibacter halophilus]|uniref:Glycosyltransferase family 4 protein n=1 Tax=Salibacter halophilus TaxID=1803916 RepID=A0A6N6M2X0_9FLAO|nr:glycosyltransferase [Salibacter halophilus]KAB1063542.1 glycosyltransferase family 4 protein [Salibacter halophilus]